jgi:FkbM family methyltransferase
MTDVGVYLRVFTLMAAGTGARVIAFEPNPRTLPYLRSNLVLNGAAEQVTVVDRAAAATAETRAFYPEPITTTS